MTTITWKLPILIDHQNFTCEWPARLRNKPGVYFFSRRYGSGSYEPFYIGKSVHMRTRLEQYLCDPVKRSRRIRDALAGEEDAYSGIRVANGPRYFHFGYVTPRSGQQVDKAIRRAEQALIQYAKILDWEVINIHHAGEAALRGFDMSGTRYSRLLPKRLVTHKRAN